MESTIESAASAEEGPSAAQQPAAQLEKVKALVRSLVALVGNVDG